MLCSGASATANQTSVNRSPRLGCLSGAIHTLLAAFKTCVFILGLYNQFPPGIMFYEGFLPLPWVQAVILVGSPANCVSGCALITWAIRLVIMYDPAKRKRWGRYTKEAGVIFRALLWSYAAIQGVTLLAVPFYGLQR